VRAQLLREVHALALGLLSDKLPTLQAKGSRQQSEGFAPD